MLKPSMIQAIGLDLDDTLWPIGPTIAHAEAVLQRWLATHAPATQRWLSDAEQRNALRERIRRDYPHQAHDVAAMRLTMIRHAMQLAGDDESLADAAFEAFVEGRHQVAFFDDALPSLQWLAARYPLVAVTNGNAQPSRMGLGDLFTATVSAQAVGAAKPHPVIFEAAAKAAGVPATAMLHVGDDAALDVLAAHAVGMQTVWVNRGDHPWTHAIEPGLQVATLHELCAALGAARE